MPELKGREVKISRRNFLFGSAAILVSSTFLPVKASASFSPFRFAFLSDARIAQRQADTSYVLTQESQLILQETIKELNRSELAFVVFGGDQVESLGENESNWQLFTEVAQYLTVPWTFILGEHDLSGAGFVDRRHVFGPDWRQKGIETETGYWSMSPAPGVHLIGLDSTMSGSNKGDISSSQLEWLKNDLITNKGKFTLICTHHPLLAPPPFDSGQPWDDYVTTNGADVRELLSLYPDVQLVISGHIPVNKVQKEGSIWHVSTAGLAIFPCIYRIFTIEPQGITIETKQINFAGFIKKAEKAFVSSMFCHRYNPKNPDAFLSIAEGSKLDQNAFLSFTGTEPKPAPKRKKEPLKNKDKGKEKNKKQGDKKERKPDNQPDKLPEKMPIIEKMKSPEPQTKSPATTPDEVSP